MDGDDPRRDGDERRFTVDLLVRLLLDDLAPAVEAYRRAVARQLDLEPVDLLCLDVVRRSGTTPSSALTAWTGLTRSALSKSLRRLERAGHVSRRGDGLGNGEVLVSVVAHEDRDRRLAELRARVRREVDGLVVDHALTRSERRAAVVGYTRTMTVTLFRLARTIAEREALRVRRRERDRRDAARAGEDGRTVAKTLASGRSPGTLGGDA